MPNPSSEDGVDAIAALKREWSLAKTSWKKWTEDVVKKEYIKQFEATGAKSEANAAVVAANGLNAEVTGIKLEHTFYDPIADYQKRKEDARLRGLGQLPEQLRTGVNEVQTQARLAMDKARDVEVKVSELRRDHTADLEGIADEFELVGDRVSQLISELGGV